MVGERSMQEEEDGPGSDSAVDVVVRNKGRLLVESNVLVVVSVVSGC